MDTRFTIHQPIWLGRQRKECFGIADFRLDGDGFITINCDYTDMQGDKVYQNAYRIHKATARTYPVQHRSGVTLYIIPISAFQEVVRV